MAENDELANRQLYRLLIEKYPAIDVSLSTVKRYCVMISEHNKEKRLEMLKWRILFRRQQVLDPTTKNDFSKVGRCIVVEGGT